MLANIWTENFAIIMNKRRRKRDMDYKELVDKLREKDGCHCECIQAADAIETLLAERDAAVRDLTKVCEDNPDACHLCKHLPCVDKDGNGHCLGFVWRGPQKGGG